MAHPLRVNAIELLRRPGSERVLDTTVTVEELGVDDPRLDPRAEVRVNLRLDVLTDGIVVNGMLHTQWRGTCRRCAADASGPLDCDVHELYQQVITDPDAFELGDLLDLEPMVREILLLDAPAVPLCRIECAGLCPVCGTDRNSGPCSCENEVSDPRWAALDQLRNDLDH